MRSTGEVDDNFDPPLTSTPRQQPRKDSTLPNVLQDVSQDEHGSQASKTFSKDSQPGKHVPTQCDNCDLIVPLANHLRESSMCLQSYRGYPEFKIKGSDEEFIVKVCLVIDECPAPLCSDVLHKKIPAQCLSWWKEVGCKTVKWRGVNSKSSSSDIKEKMRQFRKNHNRRQGGADPGSQASSTSHGPGEEHNPRDRDVRGQEDNSGTQCGFCSFSGSLAAHLQTSTCLDHYKKSHLPRRFQLESLRKIIFNLSLSLCPSFCPDPDCSIPHLSGGAIVHLNHPCSSFIMSEVVALYGYDAKGSKEVLVGKLKRRQSYLREVLRNESQFSGPAILRREVSQLMTRICCTCLIQGPMTDGQEEYKMEECIGTSPTQWQCKKCCANEDRQQHVMQEAVENVNRLSNLRADCTMEAVKVKETGDHCNRIVFVPKCFANNTPLQEEGEIIDPKRTTVLVPRHPDAIDVFPEEALQGAYEERHELKRWAEFICKRIIFINLNVAVTLLQEKKLADIKEARWKMFHSMKTSKGLILSRDPNVGDIRERNPHYDATKTLCLTDTCPWSVGHIQQKAEESTAISRTNGHLKTKVKIQVTSIDCPELGNIISIAKDHYGDRLTGVPPLAPLVLQFARGKVKLLVKHIVSKLYDNWDLKVSFGKGDFSVVLTGFLYSAEYDGINKKIAREGASLSEIVEAVTLHPEVQPTASLDPEWIADCYGIREDAEV